MLYWLPASSVVAQYNIFTRLTLLLPILRPKESHTARLSQTIIVVHGSYSYTQPNSLLAQLQPLEKENTTHTHK